MLKISTLTLTDFRSSKAYTLDIVACLEWARGGSYAEHAQVKRQQAWWRHRAALLPQAGIQHAAEAGFDRVAPDRARVKELLANYGHFELPQFTARMPQQPRQQPQQHATPQQLIADQEAKDSRSVRPTVPERFAKAQPVPEDEFAPPALQRKALSKDDLEEEMGKLDASIREDHRLGAPDAQEALEKIYSTLGQAYAAEVDPLDAGADLWADANDNARLAVRLSRDAQQLLLARASSTMWRAALRSKQPIAWRRH